MSPIPSPAQVVARAITQPGQFATVDTETRRIGHLVAKDDIAPPPSFSSAPSSKITGTTKVGLAMIPVIVASVGLYVLFLFWYRKRRATRKQLSMAPPVPEKDFHSRKGSITSQRRSSKVFRMAAFVAPLHETLQRDAPTPRNDKPAHKKNASIDKSIISYPIAPKSPSMIETGMDSPIDGSSPFRLKRGDTVKRSSLGPELSRLWPSPPASAWMKPTTDASIRAPTVRRESAIYQQGFSRHGR